LRNRGRREARALRLLRQRPQATALELGSAAIKGENRARHITVDGRITIGLTIAVDLVRRGLAVEVGDNCFARVLPEPP
jgi:hypothetical protein